MCAMFAPYLLSAPPATPRALRPKTAKPPFQTAKLPLAKLRTLHTRSTTPYHPPYNAALHRSYRQTERALELSQHNQ